MARNYVGFNVDFAEAAALSGFLKTLSTEIKTTRHIGPVLKYVHSVMSQEFTDYMTVMAASQPSRFHHVYEWGEAGNPGARLWEDVLIGGGNSRTASFRWKASKQVVPVRDDFQAAGVKQIHVFVWKAPVMEYNKQITISPKRGKILAYFTGPTNPEGKYKMQFTQNPIQVSNPGGRLTTGSFTREYVSWWGGAGSQGVFESRIRKILEEDLGKMPIESATKRFRRPTTKTFKMQTLGQATQAEAYGKAAARKYLGSRSNKYIEAAKARERIIYG
ncbi:hypothetical protein SEA_COMRADE_34 [Streptomyces phage Comrade]|uniref:Uncharacterized protein n=2 Tax=Gilsonvirus comrade TaxID=2846395 RepID=A0A385DX63_9CAUD|nr:hypothetical protein HWB84_gp212 [Streptomyces phage Comrade]AXQ63307.1 hypothetical protein SEA_COMRADE_34 [Streptomyces phage Comrade]QQO39720.1 hypothetical protein SEA_BELFORT_35 [Streptomyces phage Belfort]QZE11630.1 hypothetical protein SEA_KARP_33 [Streptomyces phage Karp]